MEPNEDYELSRVLREWRIPGAPAELEERIMSARFGPRSWGYAAGWRAKLVLAVVNVTLVVVGVLLSGVPAQPVRPRPGSAPVLTVDLEGEAPFVPVPYVAPLDSYEAATVLRGNIPVAALIAAGYRVPLADPGALVLGDVLVGDDGRVHAVRLLAGLSLEVGGD